MPPIDASSAYQEYLVEFWEEGTRQNVYDRLVASSGMKWEYLQEKIRNRQIKHLKVRDNNQQYKLDVAMWYGALFKSQPQTIEFFKRIFATLYYSGLLYKDSQGTWHKWAESDIPIASALSHGGRVMIQLPRENGNEYWEWLWGGLKKMTRFAATHGIKPIRMPERLLGNRYKYIRETGKAKTTAHYGVNIGMGGPGNINPFSAITIDTFGEHGHLYIGYSKPRNGACGGILIGCEGSAPLDRWNGRGVFASDQTGHLHTFGSSGKFSPTGGKKWKDNSWHPNEGPAKSKESMFIDLASTGWEFLLDYANYTFEPDMLGKSGNFAPLDEPKFWFPAYKEWKAWRYVSKSARMSKIVQALDAEVKVFDKMKEKDGSASEKMLCLKTIIGLCDAVTGTTYIDNKRKEAAENLKALAELPLEEIDPSTEIPNKKEWLRWSKSQVTSSHSVYLKPVEPSVGTVFQVKLFILGLKIVLLISILLIMSNSFFIQATRASFFGFPFSHSLW